MGNREIKSSIELAMEKVARMPKPSPEQIAEQQQKELAPLGRALGIKFIEGRIRLDELEIELARYREEKAPIVKGALLSSLKQAVGLDDVETNRRVLEAFDVLEPNTVSIEIRERIEAIVGDYQKEKERIREEYGREYRASLQRRGISGSSLRPNLKDAKGLRVRLDKLHEVHGQKLDELMQALPGAPK